MAVTWLSVLSFVSLPFCCLLRCDYTILYFDSSDRQLHKARSQLFCFQLN